MTDTDIKLADELKRVGSDLRFRSWTRHRLATIVVFVALDILASIVSITALVQVNHTNQASIRREHRANAASIERERVTRALNERARCTTSNEGRKAQRKLWADLVAASPPPALPPGATAAEKAARVAAVKKGVDLVAYVDDKFRARPC